MRATHLPFFGGINVVFNNFPVNPTTWYIGTHLHFLLLWAVVFRRVSITPSLLAGSIVFEILARAMLVGTLGGFVGYMMVPNWITVFLAGMCTGQHRDVEPEASVPGLLTVTAALAIVWAVSVPAFVAERSIPFMRLGHGSESLTLAITSACVSFLYLSYTWLTYQITRCVKALDADPGRGAQYRHRLHRAHAGVLSARNTLERVDGEPSTAGDHSTGDLFRRAGHRVGGDPADRAADGATRSRPGARVARHGREGRGRGRGVSNPES